MKELIKKILRKRKFAIRRLGPTFLTTFDLPADLRVLIPDRRAVCLDIGANCGQTIDLLRESLADPIIYAFEPSSEMFRTLRGKYTVSDLELINTAVGAVAGQVEFINYESSVLSSALPLVYHPESPFNDTKEKSREMVPVITIDDFLTERKLNHVSLLKSDTQGYDLNVLKGAGKSLTDGIIDYVLVELVFVSMYQKQGGVRDIDEFLDSVGYGLIGHYEIYREARTIIWCTALYGRRTPGKARL